MNKNGPTSICAWTHASPPVKRHFDQFTRIRASGEAGSQQHYCSNLFSQAVNRRGIKNMKDTLPVLSLLLNFLELYIIMQSTPWNAENSTRYYSCSVVARYLSLRRVSCQVIQDAVPLNIGYRDRRVANCTAFPVHGNELMSFRFRGIRTYSHAVLSTSMKQ